MKFSLMFEMQIAAPTRVAEARLFHECLEQVVLADTLGYHCAWEVEHHGLFEYSHSAAPEVFLAWAGARTRRIRLGHGVTLLPFRYNHPIRIAERIATLDILSEGRVNWGTGKSSSLVEQHAFQCDVKQLHDQWLEALEMIPQMWSSEVFSFKGRFFDVPPTRIIPKPVQRPHPPMFVACANPRSAASAGELGLGALNFAIGNDDLLKQKLDDYREAVRSAAPTGWRKNDHFACTPATLVLDDDRRACEYGGRGARFFSESLQAYYFSGTRPVGTLDVNRDPLGREEVDRLIAERNAPGSQVSLIIGDPVAARESVSRFVAVGVDELILLMQLGTVPHEVVLESMRTFAEKVMPHFA